MNDKSICCDMEEYDGDKCDWFLRDPTPEERKSVDDYIQSISESTGVTLDFLIAEEIKRCGNCFWFDDEDIYGWGFCDEKEVQMYCGSRCVKWKERGVETGCEG